ncbi:MAG: DUF554 domain-containing protein [Anaerolineaceae bacterium]|jgi:uncharacterized membrane protein YqgA involved in biofilm formation|nr:DUF554 domain-containing protein [Anaerolineaceae bacterium]
MIGTLINVVTILIGGTLGTVMGSRIPERIRNTVVSGLGLFVLAYGVSMFLDTQNTLLVCGSLLIGGLLGEWWKIEDGLAKLGAWLQTKFIKSNGDADADDGRFIKGFVMASLVFCIGPMAILGSIQDGLTGDYNMLAVKAVLDGFAALAFASSLGVGVIFSSVMVFVYQGTISLLANQVQAIVTDPMMLEMNAVGGVIVMGIAISSLLELRKIRLGSFLPALVIAPLLVALLELLGVGL